MAKQRKRRDPEKERIWREVIRRQRQSSLTVSAFCAVEGLKDWSFHWWQRELAKRDREKAAAKPQAKPPFGPSRRQIESLRRVAYNVAAPSNWATKDENPGNLPTSC